MRDRMTNALSALGATGGSGDTEVRRDRPAKASKTGKKAKSEGRLPRRSLEDIQAVVADVVKLVAKHPDGLRSETIRTELDLDVREAPRALRRASPWVLSKSNGQKRATVYFAGKGQQDPQGEESQIQERPRRPRPPRRRLRRRLPGEEGQGGFEEDQGEGLQERERRHRSRSAGSSGYGVRTPTRRRRRWHARTPPGPPSA